MNTKILIGVAVVFGLLLLAFLGPQDVPPPEDRGELVAGGRFVLERDGAILLEEEYTVFFHPTEGYMLLSQGEVHTGDAVISLAQQAQYDRGFLPIFYQLAAETPAGAQIISAQMGVTGLTMEVRVGLSSQEATLADVSNLALLDNNVIGHYAILLAAVRAEAIDRAFTAAVPQALLSLPAKVEGPNSIEFLAGEVTYEGKTFDVHLGDTRITLIEYEGRLVGLANWAQGTVGYEAGRFPDGIEIIGGDDADVSPEGVTEEEISFVSDGLTLAGTAAFPSGEGPFSAALFIHGSGPVDRDGNAVGMEMDAYRQLAHALAEGGIASLRFDKRGVGESEGDGATASMADLVGDVRAALAALRERPEIDPERVILIGHSEGAYLAPIVAGEDDAPAGVALLAGASRPLDEITRWQIETLLRQQGASEEQVAAALEQEDEYIAFVESSTGEWADYTVDDLKAALSWLTDETAAQLAATPLGLSWLREHYTADTEGALRGVTAPVLALNGEKDLQVPVDEGERIREILADAGNEDVIVHAIPDLNHLLRYHPEEPSLIFRHIADPVDSRVIELLLEWVLARVGG